MPSSVGTPSVVINKPETNGDDVVMTENVIISEINKDDSKIEEVEHIDTSPKPNFVEETESNSKEVGSVIIFIFHRLEIGKSLCVVTQK